MADLTSVAKLDAAQPTALDQTAYGVPVPSAPVSPVAGLTVTGPTSTEGVDQLTYLVQQEGLHLVSIFIALISVSNAATSHYVRPLVGFTIATGSSAVAAIAVSDTVGAGNIASVIKDSDSSEVAESYGFDAKGSGTGIGTSVALPVVPKLGTNIKITFQHDITGACTNGGTYRIGMSIVKL
jgi:hypothetical protein